MSEYQYYEFQAVDRPLTPDQMKELRALSSRATITPRSFENTYNWGDFKGNPRSLMETYFDAHVYVSNFGVVRLMLRLPREVLIEEMLTPYAAETLDWWTTSGHTIVEWRIEDEPSGEWVEGEGWLDRLLPIRDELLRGDYRSLYIGWLASVADGLPYHEDEEDEAEDEEGEEAYGDDGEPPDDDMESDQPGPPVPAGLGDLTPAQDALAEFLLVGPDLMAAAAVSSPPGLAHEPDPARVAEWVGLLPVEEVRAALTRLILGEGARVGAELQNRYYRSLRASLGDVPVDAAQPRRTAADLTRGARQIAEERRRREVEERQRKRREQLSALVPRFPALWATVARLAQEQTAAGYQKACNLLVDMRDAYDQVGRRPEYDAALAGFLSEHGRRAALVRRLRDAGLMA